MSQELLYTSAPRGLDPTKQGFCTVLASEGLHGRLAYQLEQLSGYRHLYPIGDDKAYCNPVSYSHVKLSGPFGTRSIISRVSDYTADYTGRSNKIAHHIVLEKIEQTDAGPAWLIQQRDIFRESWDGKCRYVKQGPKIPDGVGNQPFCEHWKIHVGDAGVAGTLAEQLLVSPKPIWLAYPISLRNEIPNLISEVIQLFSPHERWNITFSTYATKFAPDVDCKLRCVLEDSEDARLAETRGTLFSLSSPPPINEQSTFVQRARHPNRTAANKTVFSTKHLRDIKSTIATNRIDDKPYRLLPTSKVEFIEQSRSTRTRVTPPEIPAPSWRKTVYQLASAVAVGLVAFAIFLWQKPTVNGSKKGIEPHKNFILDSKHDEPTSRGPKPRQITESTIATDAQNRSASVEEKQKTMLLQELDEGKSNAVEDQFTMNSNFGLVPENRAESNNASLIKDTLSEQTKKTPEFSQKTENAKEHSQSSKTQNTISETSERHLPTSAHKLPIAAHINLQRLTQNEPSKNKRNVLSVYLRGRFERDIFQQNSKVFFTTNNGPTKELQFAFGREDVFSAFTDELGKNSRISKPVDVEIKTQEKTVQAECTLGFNPSQNCLIIHLRMSSEAIDTSLFPKELQIYRDKTIALLSSNLEAYKRLVQLNGMSSFPPLLEKLAELKKLISINNRVQEKASAENFHTNEIIRYKTSITELMRDETANLLQNTALGAKKEKIKAARSKLLEDFTQSVEKLNSNYQTLIDEQTKITSSDTPLEMNLDWFSISTVTAGTANPKKELKWSSANIQFGF